MTRTVTDAALMLQILAGHDARDPGSVSHPVPDYTVQLDSGVRGKKIGVAREFFFEDCDPEVTSAVEAALDVFRGLGAAVQDIMLPDMQAARAAGTVILFAEAAAYHAADLRERPHAFSDEVRALIEMGGFYTAVQYIQAQRLRRRLTAETRQALATYDAIVMPTSPVPATPITPDPPGHAALRPRNTLPFDFISLPAISVPCGFTHAGLPVGLQIVGKAFDEAGILRVARAYEQATAWHNQHPVL
jgi:aspartyl-tRNA(Asn)/glutamyl-tRNA(Gln) amidotransferase subunit A